jgi:hypothetical protein
MEELMPELVELVLGQVDRLDLVACRFVCTTWVRASPPQDAEHHQHTTTWSKQVAANGWLGVLRWARAKGYPWDESICAQAAEGGHLDVLRWSRANGCPWNELTCAKRS